ncbi:MAG: hypothetical protein OXC08_10935 [Thiotrichales bacterium]|nr:hypothetical protein [Thiotrichales bacterium]
MDLSLQFRGISRPQLSHSSFGLDLQLALALGVVLLSMAVMVNAGVMALRATAVRSAYA